MAKILILGGGFGGLVAAERLAQALVGSGGGNNGHQITVVSLNRKFTFYPALVRLAFGHCSQSDISFDLVAELNQIDVRFVEGAVIKIKPDLKRVEIAGADFNGELSYDYLVIALGRRLATEKIGGFFEYAHHILGVQPAYKFGEAVKSFQKGEIVVGLAPQAFLPVPVCETAFALAGKFKQAMANDRKVSITVVFPDTIKDAFGGADLHRRLERAFEKHDISLVTNFPIKEVTEKTILTETGESLPYDLLMLIPPFRGQAMIGNLGITDDDDFVRTDNLMRVEGLEKVYAAGDIVALSGPKLAYMATRQGQIAAENILSEISGITTAPHKPYRHEIAAIIDQGGEDAIFLHYGIWDKSLYQLKEGKMWSRMKNTNNQLWEVVREGFQKF